MNLNLNAELIKKIAVYGAIFGAIMAILALIPSLMALCLLILFCAAAPCVMYWLKTKERADELDENLNCMILGGIIGFVSCGAFFVVLTPLVFISNLIFRAYANSMLPYLLSDALWLFVLIVIALAFVFAASNAVSAVGVKILLDIVEKQKAAPKKKDLENDPE